MNTTIITILTIEIVFTGLIVYGLVRLSCAVKFYDRIILAQNKKLKKSLPMVREIFALTHQYIEMWKADFAQKIEACGNLLGEVAVYYLMHKIFKKQYESFETGFNFIKLFW